MSLMKYTCLECAEPIKPPHQYTVGGWELDCYECNWFLRTLTEDQLKSLYHAEVMAKYEHFFLITNMPWFTIPKRQELLEPILELAREGKFDIKPIVDFIDHTYFWHESLVNKRIAEIKRREKTLEQGENDLEEMVQIMLKTERDALDKMDHPVLARFAFAALARALCPPSSPQ